MSPRGVTGFCGNPIQRRTTSALHMVRQAYHRQYKPYNDSNILDLNSK